MSLLLALFVESLRCEGSDAIGAKRTCRERRERVDLTKMTRADMRGSEFLQRKLTICAHIAGRKILL
jgi:hypothetical protein